MTTTVYVNAGGKLVHSNGGKVFGFEYLEGAALQKAYETLGLSPEGEEILTNLAGEVIKDEDEFIVTLGQFKGKTVGEARKLREELELASEA